ncbi:MAG: hypothetical protein U9N73_12365 [Candidatus Auribacterota bacterium]|nr:hypothetical protein [Candidatus Auribacterota bacterium]
MKITVKIILITMLLFNSSCALPPLPPEKTWESVCWHRALYSAIAVKDNEQNIVRVVRGKLRGSLHDQAQVWDEDSNEWLWITADQWGVHTEYSPYLDNFIPEEYFNMYEYLEFAEQHFFKSYPAGSTVVIN